MLKRPKGRKLLTRVAALLLVLMYMVQVFNYSCYLHTHVLDSGQVIMHAHPYDKSKDSAPVKSHKHTWVQIITLQNLSFIFPVFFFFFFLVIAGRRKYYDGFEINALRPACIGLSKGRAPPFS